MDRELSYRQCLEFLASQRVGRAAFCTPIGPEIVPVNYAVVDDAVVFRTSPYSRLGAHGRETRVAFEVDQIDASTRSGTSVVVHGRCSPVETSAEAQAIRMLHDPDPWAEGSRWLYLKLSWTALTGRRIGAMAPRPGWKTDFVR